MPPVLHVAFAELAAGSAQEMVAGDLRRRPDQRQDILKLIAEAVGTAGLVECRPAPEAAAQHLIKQPAVQQQVQGPVGRSHLDRAEQSLPTVLHLRERLLYPSGLTVEAQELPRFLDPGCLAEQE